MVTERIEEIENIIAYQELDVRDEYGSLLAPEVAKRMYDIQWVLAVGMTRENYKKELGKRYELEDSCDEESPPSTLLKLKLPKLEVKRVFAHPPVSIYEIDT